MGKITCKIVSKLTSSRKRALAVSAFLRSSGSKGKRKGDLALGREGRG